jgi:hypothetical protein
VTLPTPDAQSASSFSHRSQYIFSPAHSIPDSHSPVTSSQAASSPAFPPFVAVSKSADSDHEHALDFATHSWDLATGGMKVLTAKRELLLRPERRSPGVIPDIVATSRSYLFALVILACVVLMLIGGGIVLLVMLQP